MTDTTTNPAADALPVWADSSADGDTPVKITVITGRSYTGYIEQDDTHAKWVRLFEHPGNEDRSEPCLFVQAAHIVTIAWGDDDHPYDATASHARG
jgi:hypothetical protein